MVTGGSWSCRFDYYKDRKASLARYGSTPIHLHLEEKYLVESTVPLERPPPPIGKII